ncbi:hypothetical protein TNCV_989551 [Trichonephila clavipes]|nr:hypothetical protein TNCV_989551 [Trichonephila clavipes]
MPLIEVLALIGENSSNQFLQSSLDPNFCMTQENLQCEKKVSLQKRVAWRCPDGTQHLFCSILAISGQSLASDGPDVGRREPKLVFGHVDSLKMVRFQFHQIHSRTFPVLYSWLATALSCFTAP